MALVLPTDGELVGYAAATYAANAKPFISDLDSSIRVFLTTRDDGLNVIAFEGTHDVLGWALDFFAIKVEDHETVNHPTLGFLHAGFYRAALTVLPRLSLVAKRGRYAICGHSLGAVLALMVGALLIDDGTPPVKIGAFAPPKGGGDMFVKVAASVPYCAYRYGQDPVPLVPLAFPELPYRQVSLVELDAPRSVDLFSYHNIANYVTGVKAFNAGNTDA